MLILIFRNSKIPSLYKVLGICLVRKFRVSQIPEFFFNSGILKFRNYYYISKFIIFWNKNINRNILLTEFNLNLIIPKLLSRNRPYSVPNKIFRNSGRINSYTYHQIQLVRYDTKPIVLFSKRFVDKSYLINGLFLKHLIRNDI